MKASGSYNVSLPQNIAHAIYVATFDGILCHNATTTSGIRIQFIQKRISDPLEETAFFSIKPSKENI